MEWKRYLPPYSFYQLETKPVKGQLRISRVRRPRATLLAILMLGGAYYSLGLWVHGQQIVDHNPPVQVAEQQVIQQIDEQIEQMSKRIVSVVHKPGANIIRIVHAL